MDFKKSRKIMTFLVVIGAVIAMFACVFVPSRLLFGLFLAAAAIIMAAGFVVGGLYYKCPHCGRSLMACRGAVPKACPHCSERL